MEDLGAGLFHNLILLRGIVASIVRPDSVRTDRSSWTGRPMPTGRQSRILSEMDRSEDFPKNASITFHRIINGFSACQEEQT
jgi:hypothetical protein